MNLKTQVTRKIAKLEAELAKLREVAVVLDVKVKPVVKAKPVVEVEKPRRNGKPGRRVKCAHCGRGFIAHRKDQKHCSKECTGKAWWHAHKAELNAKRMAERHEQQAHEERAAKRGTVLIPGAQK